VIIILTIAWWLEGRALRREITALEQQIAELREMPPHERAILDRALFDRSARSYHAALRQCAHGFHHPEGPHSCDGCWCEGERDRAMYGWDHNTDPKETP